MMLLDSDIVIDIFRGHGPAIAWLAVSASTTVELPGIVTLEVLQGCRNLVEQQRCELFLRRYVWRWPSEIDCERGFEEYAAHRLRHGLGLLDALIAATAIGRGEELATFNVKHFSVIPGLRTIQPY